MPKRTLSDSYRFPGFKPKIAVRGVFGDSHARIIQLVRQGKKLSAVSAGRPTGRSTTTRLDRYETSPVVPAAFISNWTSDVSVAGGAAR